MTDEASWEVRQVPGVGRVLAATRNIAQWQTVIEDAALVAGPKHAPVCLGCLRALDPSTAVQCARCGWPLCSAQCEAAPRHQVECAVLARGGLAPELTKCLSQQQQHPLYPVVTVLRVLLLKTRD